MRLWPRMEEVKQRRKTLQDDLVELQVAQHDAADAARIAAPEKIGQALYREYGIDASRADIGDQLWVASRSSGAGPTQSVIVPSFAFVRWLEQQREWPGLSRYDARKVAEKAADEVNDSDIGTRLDQTTKTLGNAREEERRLDGEPARATRA